MRVLVIGGSGFIGCHAVQALLAQGDEVAVLCRNTETVERLFGGEVAALCGDVQVLRTADYRVLLAGFDAVVFAAGADERSEVQGDVHKFFQRANVEPCEQLFSAIPGSSVRRAVLLSSIFAWFDQQRPELQLAQRHPYIASRVDQDRVAHAAVAGSACVLVTVQVPWVFGGSRHRESQWGALVNYVRAAAPLMCIRGGACMLSVTTLAQAISGALRYPCDSVSLPVGDENLSYVELMQRLCPLVGRKDNNVLPVRDGFFRDITALGDFFGKLFGKRGGLDLRGMADLLFENIFIDIAHSQALLHYHGGDLDDALRDTVAAVPEGTWLGSWRKSLNWFARG